MRSLIVLIALLIDQFSKGYVIQNFSEKAKNLFFFIDIVPVWNCGISFGFLSTYHTDIYLYLVSIISLLCLIMAFYLYFSREFLNKLGYGLILGGSLGNLLDRIKFGAVFDFIDMNLLGIHFYTFNLADFFINIGAFLVILEFFFKKKINKFKF